MKKIIIIIVVIAVVIAGSLAFYYAASKQIVPLPPAPAATSTPASGTPPSASGTTPPSPMPIPSTKGMVNGKVLLGPTCPVEHIPPDPNCAPKPYQTIIRIQPANPSAPYVTVNTDASGTFSASLDPGTYTFHAEGRNNSYYPRCGDVQIQVVAGGSQAITIDCDTGIR